MSWRVKPWIATWRKRAAFMLVFKLEWTPQQEVISSPHPKFGQEWS